MVEFIEGKRYCFKILLSRFNLNLLTSQITRREKSKQERKLCKRKKKGNEKKDKKAKVRKEQKRKKRIK